MYISEERVRKLVRIKLCEIYSTAKKDVEQRAEEPDIPLIDKKKKEKPEESGQIHVKNPVNVKKYPVKNVRSVEAAMDKHGITNKFMRIAILSVIAKESGMVPKNEKGYGGTSNSRIKHIFGRRVSGLADSALNALKKNVVAFFDKMYGGKYGNNQPGDGYKYRGRGFNQVTFKNTYKKMGNLIGKNLVANPDLLNQVPVAAEVAVAFLLRRLKKYAPDYNEVTSQEKANIIAARANAGWGKIPGASSAVDRAIASTKDKNKYFSYGLETGSIV